jgi:hypothetical protein
MALQMVVTAEFLEDGDLVNMSEVVVPAELTDMEEIPDEFVRVVGEPEDVDKYNVKIYLDCGYVVVERDAKVPYSGSIYEIEPQYV